MEIVNYSNAYSTTVRGNNYIVDGSTLDFALPTRVLNDDPSLLQVSVNNVVQANTAFSYPGTQLGVYGVSMLTYISNSTLEIRVFQSAPDEDDGLVTLAEVKSFLTIASPTYDAKLSNIILYASGLIESYCSRNFRAADVIYEYQDGGKPYVFVNRIPINSIYSVSEYDGGEYIPIQGVSSDGGLPNVVANSNSAASYTWDSDSGKIWKGTSVLISSSLNSETQSFNPYSKGVRISYNGGYTSVPNDIKLCTLYLVKDIHKGMDDKITSIGREQLEKMPYSGGFPPHIRRVLDLYRLVV